MPKPHPATDYTAFEKYVKPLLTELFVGFRLKSYQVRFRSNGKRPDYTLMRIGNHRERMVADAKFYDGRITTAQVKTVQAYKGYPFFARHAALLFPSCCDVEPSAKRLAEEKKVMLVQLPVLKKLRYEWRRRMTIIPWRAAVGYEVGCELLSTAEVIARAIWITAPTYEIISLQHTHP